MRLIFLVSLLISIVRDVRCYLLPISEDTGKALDGIISIIRSSLPKCLDYFHYKLEPVPEPTFWEKLADMIGYKKEKEIDSIDEPLLLCNSFILVVLTATLIIYFSLSRCYNLSITKKKKLPNIPFLCDEDDENEVGSDVDSSIHFARSCAKCNCSGLFLGRGDSR